MSESKLTSSSSPLFKYYALSLALTLVLFVLGAASASLTLLSAAAIVGYGWPFFYVYRLKAQEIVEEAPKAAKQLQARPSAVGVR